MKLEIQSYLEYNDNGEVSPVILWDALIKAVVRGKIIAISSVLKKRRKQKLHELESKLRKLVKENSVSLCNSARIKNKRSTEVDRCNKHRRGSKEPSIYKTTVL